ncbi:hypothetical protein ACHAWF_003232, partial [Thalassiosira exigua]
RSEDDSPPPAPRPPARNSPIPRNPPAPRPDICASVGTQLPLPSPSALPPSAAPITSSIFRFQSDRCNDPHPPHRSRRRRGGLRRLRLRPVPAGPSDRGVPAPNGARHGGRGHRQRIRLRREDIRGRGLPRRHRLLDDVVRAVQGHRAEVRRAERGLPGLRLREGHRRRHTGRVQADEAGGGSIGALVSLLQKRGEGGCRERGQRRGNRSCD